MSTPKQSLRTHQIVARNIRIQARHRKLKYKDIGAILGKSRPVIQSRMSGRVEFRISELETLAAVMNLEVMDFFAGTSYRGNNA